MLLCAFLLHFLNIKSPSPLLTLWPPLSCIYNNYIYKLYIQREPASSSGSVTISSLNQLQHSHSSTYRWPRVARGQTHALKPCLASTASSWNRAEHDTRPIVHACVCVCAWVHAYVHVRMCACAFICVCVHIQ